MNILNLGAGVQSTALYLMSLRGEVERFDYAIFADTQDEPRAVYDHLEWLKSLGGPEILTATAGRLGDDLIKGVNSTGQRIATIPAFVASNDGVAGGVSRRQCTAEYKIKVVERVIRRQIFGLEPGHRFPKGTNVRQFFGLSWDEASRIVRVQRNYLAVSWATPHFPLWDMEMDRNDCIKYLRDFGIPHEVPRSACVFCPYHSNAEWRRLRDADPESWARAIEVDEGMRASGKEYRRSDSSLYLHKSCRPLAEAPIDTPESRGEQHLFGFARECEGMCGV